MRPRHNSISWGLNRATAYRWAQGRAVYSIVAGGAAGLPERPLPGTLPAPVWVKGSPARRAGAAAQAQQLNDVLAQQQAIYEELLASHELEGAALATAGSQRKLSLREITRDLGGWSSPAAGPWRTAKP